MNLTGTVWWVRRALISGKNFASFFSYKSKHFIFFYIGQLAVLLYKL